MSAPIVSHNFYLWFNWVSAAVLTVCFFTRSYIRWVCFGGLLVEDWLMAGSLAIFISCAAVWQVYLEDMYNMMNAVEGKWLPGPTFMEDTKYALLACGSLSIIVYIGLWLIKASFLVLFYRLGNKINIYRYVWWACAVFVMGCGAAGLGLNQYECLFDDINDIFATCLTPESLHDVWRKEVAAAVLDVVSDILLIIFPIWILWSTRFSLRQKLVFSCVFALVGFTVAMAIVRGAYSKIIVQQPELALRQINVMWPFWFTVEYVTSFLVACAISFRSLFVQHRNKLSAAGAADARRATPRSSVQKRNRIQYYLDKMSLTLVSTAWHLEGGNYDHDTWKLPMPTSGLMTVDFSSEQGWRPRAGGEEEDGESMRALKRPDPAHAE
ncbi:hypothetical protein QBC35DRAFT_505680 [Podospora australis]|uniref:Rhodopsin domain-containing protein n=1 Tax=Podospora australis TaxID=1536484 RepID=A0AAN7ADJ2_9PEZI|nr:hypothetical protein QBC35DRAFT_505680 [Podospora australis]